MVEEEDKEQPKIPISKYGEYQEKPLDVLLKTAPPQNIRRLYNFILKDLKKSKKQDAIDDGEISKDNTDEMIKFIEKNAAIAEKHKSILIPIIDDEILAWSDIRELMKFNGGEMVANDAVDALRYFLYTKAVKWISTMVEIAQGREITEEIVMKAILKDSINGSV